MTAASLKRQGRERRSQSEGLIAAYLPLPMERNPAVATLVQYVDRIVGEVRAMPGVRETAVASGLPLRGWGDRMPFRMADKPNEPAETGFKVALRDQAFKWR
jgi:hypothetical protein